MDNVIYLAKLTNSVGLELNASKRVAHRATHRKNGLTHIYRPLHAKVDF